MTAMPPFGARFSVKESSSRCAVGATGAAPATKAIDRLVTIRKLLSMLIRASAIGHRQPQNRFADAHRIAAYIKRQPVIQFLHTAGFPSMPRLAFSACALP